MPGIATQFEILRLTIERLEATGDPGNIAKTMSGPHSAYAHLGALGPLLGDFLPSEPFPLDEVFPQDYPTLWRRIFSIMGRKEKAGPPRVPPGLFPLLKKINDLLNTLQPIVDAQDCDKIQDLQDSSFEEDVTQVSTDLEKLLAGLSNVYDPNGDIQQLVTIISQGLKPKVCTDSPSDAIPPVNEWSSRDVLHWKKPGKFIRALLDTARDKKDDRLLAYAYGYLVSYAGNACGSSFINSIVGGPPRTQWWRQRFVQNYVDAWVYGYYNQTSEPTFSGDDPTPPYDAPAWHNLCSANLQQRIQIGNPDPEELMDLVARVKPLTGGLDNNFRKHWFEAFKQTYGTVPDGVDADSLNSAYWFTWLILWFRTSGKVLGCDPTLPEDPGCAEDPPELDPFAGGFGTTPADPPEFDNDVFDEEAFICGIILAILSGLSFLGGGVAAGGAALAGAVALLDCDNLVDWQTLRCTLYWYRMYVHNAQRGIHRLLTLTALDYPYARELGVDPDFGDLFAQEFGLEPWETGKNLTKSKPDRAYPSKCWDGSLGSFNRPPTDSDPGFETPRTLAYLTAAYPRFFVADDVENPLSNRDVKSEGTSVNAADGGRFRADPSPLAQTPVQFGNAVANSVDLFQHLASSFPDWNLDADRGLAYLTWQFIAGYDPDNVQIKPEA